jgi:beta-fructofuranosidase
MKEWTKEERYRVLESPEEIRTLHERTARSDYRQIFHIQPVTGLLNDPNGFVWYNGSWHLFYQWCPWGAVHGLKYWYHTSSPDLIHWENLGICISPDSEYDNKGAYSGSALPGKDSVCLFYTGNHRDPDWKRISYTCLVKLYEDGRRAKLPWPLFGPSPDYTEHQRDPKIIYVPEKKEYFIIIGAQTMDKKGCVIIYRSPALLDGWEFAGQLKVPGFEDFGGMWECPSIEKISGQDVLLFCPQHIKLPGRGENTNHNGYILGNMDWDTLTFTPSGSFHVLDFGFDSYAAECAANIEDRDYAVLTAWMGLPDSSYPTDEEDWQGCLTMPRELTVRGRRLIQKPLADLKALRMEELDPEPGVLPRTCELEVLSGGGDLDLKLFSHQDGSGGLDIHYDDDRRMVTVDRSGVDRRFNESMGEIREHSLENRLSHMRIFIDRSSVEIFVNNGDAVFSSRIFPTAGENGFVLSDNASMRIWRLDRAVQDDFVV